MIKISERKLREIVTEALSEPRADVDFDDETIEAIADEIVEMVKDEQAEDEDDS